MLGEGTVFVIWCVGGSSESECSQYTFIHTVYIQNVLNMSNMHTTLTGHVQWCISGAKEGADVCPCNGEVGSTHIHTSIRCPHWRQAENGTTIKC